MSKKKKKFKPGKKDVRTTSYQIVRESSSHWTCQKGEWDHLGWHWVDLTSYKTEMEAEKELRKLIDQLEHNVQEESLDFFF